MDGILEGMTLEGGKAESEGECEDQSCHYIHQRRYGHGKVRREFGG